jgi:hypothetical protein
MFSQRQEFHKLQNGKAAAAGALALRAATALPRFCHRFFAGTGISKKASLYSLLSFSVNSVGAALPMRHSLRRASRPAVS